MALASFFMGIVRLVLVKELAVGVWDSPYSIDKTWVALLGIALTVLAYSVGGSRHPLWARVLGIGKYVTKGQVLGEVAPGFEAVRVAFQKNVDEGLERGAQFVVYHKGEKVVDLYGGTLGPGYDGESLQFTFSSSKNLAAIVIARAVAEGHIDYEAKVSQYWPEFAQQGKEDITVAQVLRHESGLAYFPKGSTINSGQAKRERLDEIAEFIAAQPPLWAEKMSNIKPYDRVYHGLTRGFILQELVRRTDPEHRTIGQIIRAELAEPLGISMVLGDPTLEERKRVWSLKFNTIPEVIAHYYVKILSGKRTEDEKLRMSNLLDKTSPIKRQEKIIWYDIPNRREYYNHEDIHNSEIPSVNVLTNARALAKVADLMVRHQLFPEKVHQALSSKPVVKYDHLICMNTTFTQGGFCKFDGASWPAPAQGFCGWGGFGGSVFAWNEELDLAIAYTMNGPFLDSILGFRDERCLRLTQTVRYCLEKAVLGSKAGEKEE